LSGLDDATDLEVVNDLLRGRCPQAGAAAADMPREASRATSTLLSHGGDKTGSKSCFREPWGGYRTHRKRTSARPAGLLSGRSNLAQEDDINWEDFSQPSTR